MNNPSQIQLVIVSPEKEVLNIAVEMAIIPGADGDLGILAGHSAVITSLRCGELVVYNDKKPQMRLFLTGGLAEISPDKISVLAENITDLAKLNQESLNMEIAQYQKLLEISDEMGKNNAQINLDNAILKSQIFQKSSYN